MGEVVFLSVLSQSDIQRLIEKEPPLLAGYVDLEAQLQPNGFDITLREVALMQSAGTLGVNNANRVLPPVSTLVFDEPGFIHLAPGNYLVTYNEIVNLPSDVMALGRPRSSLLRCGVAVHNAVWDAGYHGRSQSLLVVYNSQGFQLERNARIVQLVFLQLTSHTLGYQGAYQGENI
jgi:dUTP pyrophosphatase